MPTLGSQCRCSDMYRPSCRNAERCREPTTGDRVIRTIAGPPTAVPPQIHSGEAADHPEASVPPRQLRHSSTPLRRAELIVTCSSWKCNVTSGVPTTGTVVKGAGEVASRHDGLPRTTPLVFVSSYGSRPVSGQRPRSSSHHPVQERWLPAARPLRRRARQRRRPIGTTVTFDMFEVSARRSLGSAVSSLTRVPSSRHSPRRWRRRCRPVANGRETPPPVCRGRGRPDPSPCRQGRRKGALAGMTTEGLSERHAAHVHLDAELFGKPQLRSDACLAVGRCAQRTGVEDEGVGEGHAGSRHRFVGAEPFPTHLLKDLVGNKPVLTVLFGEPVTKRLASLLVLECFGDIARDTSATDTRSRMRSSEGAGRLTVTMAYSLLPIQSYQRCDWMPARVATPPLADSTQHPTQNPTRPCQNLSTRRTATRARSLGCSRPAQTRRPETRCEAPRRIRADDGSEGWGFESLRARCKPPGKEGDAQGNRHAKRREQRKGQPGKAGERADGTGPERPGGRAAGRPGGRAAGRPGGPPQAGAAGAHGRRRERRSGRDLADELEGEAQLEMPGA